MGCFKNGFAIIRFRYDWDGVVAGGKTFGLENFWYAQVPTITPTATIAIWPITGSAFFIRT